MTGDFLQCFFKGGGGETSMKLLHFDEDHVRIEIASLSYNPNSEHAEMPRQPMTLSPEDPGSEDEKLAGVAGTSHW